MVGTDSFCQPNPFGFTVYTKKGCRNCSLVKMLLDIHFEKGRTASSDSYQSAEIIPCDNYLVSEQKPFFVKFMNSLTKDKFKTFPIVFHNGDFIGGYVETRVFLQTKVF